MWKRMRCGAIEWVWLFINQVKPRLFYKLAFLSEPECRFTVEGHFRTHGTYYLIISRINRRYKCNIYKKIIFALFQQKEGLPLHNKNCDFTFQLWKEVLQRDILPLNIQNLTLWTSSVMLLLLWNITVTVNNRLIK